MSIADNLSALIQTFVRKDQKQPATNADILNVSRNLSEIQEASASAVENLQDSVVTINTTLSTKQDNCVQVNYDFDTDGGEVGVIPSGVSIPANSIISKVYYRVLEAPTSAGSTGTIALLLTGAEELITPITADGAASGIVDGVPDWTGASMIETTTGAELAFEIETEDITAGQLAFFVFYNTYA